jgi:hypothetical protein
MFYVGAMAKVYSGEQAEEDLAKAQRERAARAKASRRHVPKGGNTSSACHGSEDLQTLRSTDFEANLPR